MMSKEAAEAGEDPKSCARERKTERERLQGKMENQIEERKRRGRKKEKEKQR